MSAEKTISAGTERPQRLPRGRHGLSQELVTANQRERLFAAVAETIAEKGYASLVVSDVTSGAGVSRATFYKLFEDKHECVLGAQLWAFDSLQEELAEACSGESEWPLAVAAAVRRAIEFASESPGEARLALISYHAISEPRLAIDGLDLHGRLLALLDAGAAAWPGARRPSGTAVELALASTLSMIGACLSSGNPAGLDCLAPDLTQTLLSPYLGGNEARRIAHAA